jgi:hypothetical protein
MERGEDSAQRNRPEFRNGGHNDDLGARSGEDRSDTARTEDSSDGARTLRKEEPQLSSSGGGAPQFQFSKS